MYKLTWIQASIWNSFISYSKVFADLYKSDDVKLIIQYQVRYIFLVPQGIFPDLKSYEYLYELSNIQDDRQKIQVWFIRVIFVKYRIEPQCWTVGKMHS